MDKQRMFNINTTKHIFTDNGVSSNRTGFPPMSEAELLRNLSNALQELERLQKAVANMRSMVTNGTDEIVTPE